MTFPSDIGVIDLMMGIPEGHKKDWYGFLRAGLMDDESKEMEFPAQYMFKERPRGHRRRTPTRSPSCSARWTTSASRRRCSA